MDDGPIKMTNAGLRIAFVVDLDGSGVDLSQDV
jgi:hypothetical protein